MLSVYWFCFAIGGVFVLLAVLGGVDGANFDAHFDFDSDIELASDADSNFDSDVEVSDPGDRPPVALFQRPRPSPWLFLQGMLKSLKFWTFGLCFFGLTGLVLSHLLLPAGVVAIAAVIMGILCGAMVTGALQVLRRRQTDSLVRANDLVGLTGVVELPLSANSRGKVRLRVKGSVVDFIAYTEEPKEIAPGEQVLVVGMEQNRLWVVAAEKLVE
ncbi:MAG TPA: NfeD family protein [Allocoleopsis sp.]